MSITIDRDVEKIITTTESIRVRFAAIYEILSWSALSGEVTLKVGAWERMSDAAAFQDPVIYRVLKFENIRTTNQLDQLHSNIEARLAEIFG